MPGQSVRPNMNKKLLCTLIDSKIAFNKVTLIGEIRGGGFIHIICATCQLIPEQQKNYPIKEFRSVHLHLLSFLNLIIGFLEFKGANLPVTFASHIFQNGVYY